MELSSTLRLALFSGKGGVGKTTIACGLALTLAQKLPQESILLLSTDPAHSLGDVLQKKVDDRESHLTTNLCVKNLDAAKLLQEFKQRYGEVLQLLVERGSFVTGEDLTPVWDLNWPGIDELMGLLEIQRLLQEEKYDRIIVDMAPSGHTLNLLELMNFLDELLTSLELFQEKHRCISQSFTGKYQPDEADEFLKTLKAELLSSRNLLQNNSRTSLFLVAIAEPMSYFESQRLLVALEKLNIPCGGLLLNQIIDDDYEQQEVIDKFILLADTKPVWLLKQQIEEPLGEKLLLHAIGQIYTPTKKETSSHPPAVIIWPEKILPGLSDFLSQKRRLLVVGGKGGVGKTTVSAAIAWAMAQKHPQANIRIVSIDPAHSLGDAFAQTLGHEPSWLLPNLKAQEVDTEIVLQQFRQDYLWELAAMMSGEDDDSTGIAIAYGPGAWRKIVDQALPGVDEMLSLLTALELLEQQQEDLIILDTAPTGHLLRFLEMPTALADWLAWIFKLWLKYQDVLGRTKFMNTLRHLRQRVIKAQKILQDPQQTEFIGVVLQRQGVIAEAQRLFASIEERKIQQNYVIINRFTGENSLSDAIFPDLTQVYLPMLPRSVSAIEIIQGAANCLFFEGFGEL